MNGDVRAWEEQVTIPTYGIGKAEKVPLFLEQRIYQGSSGVIYPHPIIEKVDDNKTDKAYKALFVENEFIKIMILPELGGRIQLAFDKIAQRHFIYYNQVIKPALVGLTGPWISGGIEFNWPQHHRPSTFEPVDYQIEENPDGSKTIWVNEVEIMFHTKGMAGYTLYPDKAYLEVKVKLYNRTPFAQTFLWWANPAVKVNDYFQSVFPPDVHAVLDHGKRDVSSFPIATGSYYKVNYAPGTDISWYKNIPVPTSYMAANSKYDFIGGYEHDSGGGMLHIADHQVSPGKKQWTWGKGDFGDAWQKNLTDQDGPYIEIMTGVFTDNQPDFSWIQPNEEREFQQYFLPYTRLGLVKNATKDALINLEVADHSVKIKLYTTAVYSNLYITLFNDNKEVWKQVTNTAPANVFEHDLSLGNWVDGKFKIEVKTTDGVMLINYQQEANTFQPVPDPAIAPAPPREVDNNEQLYLIGLHLEQYRHATFSALDYYEEAIRRDPLDVRNNNALGLWHLKRGQFLEAEGFFRKAIQRLTERNLNPYNGEPLYNLGLSLKFQDKIDHAYDAFYKASWNAHWQDTSFLELSRISLRKGDFNKALSFVKQALHKNSGSHLARHLQVILLRKTGRIPEAISFAQESLKSDPFNYGCLFELYILMMQDDKESAVACHQKMKELMHDQANTYLDYALDYIHAGCFQEAGMLLLSYIGKEAEIFPMVYYYAGWCYFQQEEFEKANHYWELAALMVPDWCFPNRVEDIIVLTNVVRYHSNDAKAHYYLGCCLYDKSQFRQAIYHWEESAQLNEQFFIVWRNLAMAYFNKEHNPAKALAAMEKAFQKSSGEPRIMMELFQLYQKLNKPLPFRLEFLEGNKRLVLSRDDLYLEYVGICNLLQDYDGAAQLLARRQFHPWEGGEGKTAAQYLLCKTELAKQALLGNKYERALELLNECTHYPANLGEGKLFGAMENDLNYFKGIAHQRLRHSCEAELFFKQATKGQNEPKLALNYNDPQPDKIFYQGLAWSQLGEGQKANGIFEKLIKFGDTHLNDQVQQDYFMVSFPYLMPFNLDLNKENKIHCLYIRALGLLGLKKFAAADKAFGEILYMRVDHQGAIIHQRMIYSDFIR
jgi:tetratricopeptide (TPR) repeat protein